MKIRLRNLWEMKKQVKKYEISLIIFKYRCRKIVRLATIGYISKEDGIKIINRLKKINEDKYDKFFEEMELIWKMNLKK